MASSAPASRYSRAVGVEAVQRRQLVEQLDGQAGDVGRVGRVVVAALGELAMLRRDTSRRWWRVPLAPPTALLIRLTVSTSTPSRSAASLNVKRSTPNIVATASRISAPATMMSARPGSRPAHLGSAGRACGGRRARRRPRVSSLRVNSKQLYVRSGSAPVAAWTMRAIASAVPDEATATSKPCASTARAGSG